MWLPDLSIRRPVLTLVTSVLIVLFGVVSLKRLPVQEYPTIDPVVVSVSTIYPGANAEVVERTVTEVLEDELATIDGIKTLTSTSQQDISTINLEFVLERDLDIAAQDVRDRVARVRGELPTDVEEPIVSKQESDAQPIIWLSLSGERYSLLELTDVADRRVTERLQTVPGVSKVQLVGGREYAMRIIPDPIRMAGYNLSVRDLTTALRQANVELPAGRIEGFDREWTINTNAGLNTPEAFSRLIIKATPNGSPVYLGDVAEVLLDSVDHRSIARRNGETAVAMGVVKQSGANTLAVAEGVSKKLEAIQQELPKGMAVNILYNQGDFIEASIEQVVHGLYEALIIVVAVIWLFLNSLRTTFIPAVVIPVSVLGTFVALDALGFSVNTLTLLALLLSIGLVVDDAIVVLEAIDRRLKQGLSPLRAAQEGTEEVGFAVIATSVALLAVFFPIGYLTGVVGPLMREFAFSIMGTIVISTLLSLSLTPMMASRLLRAHESERSGQLGWQQRLAGWGRRWRDGYIGALADTLRSSWVLVLSVVLLLAFTGVSFLFLPREFIPTEDRGNIFTIVMAPEGSSLDYTDQAMRQVEALYKTIPEIKHFFTITEGNTVSRAFVFARLKDERDRKQQEVVQSLYAPLGQIQQAMVFPINPPSGPARSFGQDYQVAIQGTDIQRVHDYGQQLLAWMAQQPGYMNPDNELKLNKPQLEVYLNRPKLAALGLTPLDLSETLQVLFGSQKAGTFNRESKRYDVIVQLDPALRRTPNVLNTIPLLLPDGSETVPLSSLVTWQETVGPSSILHLDRERSTTVKANLLPFISMGQAMDATAAKLEELLPADMSYQWQGTAKDLAESSGGLYQLFGLSLLVVYLVLAAQFESFLHPFIVLLTVPLAVSGGVLTLFVFGASLNVYSQVAFILLIGLVSKNGILLVEYCNQLAEQHPSWPLARVTLEAAKVRFRPIMMTSLATFFGILPISLGLGAGAESRQPMGLAIMGGMLVSTALTLFVVPLAYLWLVGAWLRFRGIDPSQGTRRE